jgi:plasmid stabilization system protein ParE
VARRKPKLVVEYSPTSLRQLKEIWTFNAGRHGAKWADSYIAFLERGISLLSDQYMNGKSVENSPELKYWIIKKRNSGDGHLAVFEVEEQTGTVKIHLIFHTKQDWQSQLREV